MGKVYLVTTEYDTGCGRGGEEKKSLYFLGSELRLSRTQNTAQLSRFATDIIFNENFYNTVISCSTDQLGLSGNHSSGLAAVSQGKYRLRKTECDFISDF
jgi:hypothetical protein